jgi:hypothetical protein
LLKNKYFFRYGQSGLDSFFVQLYFPHTVVLADQNFPAVLPVNGMEQCLKIIRIENGGLLELADELLNLVGNRRVPPGSIVLLFSPTHLTKVGLSAYISDHLAAAKTIQDLLGRETRVAPLPPLLLAGCSDKTTIREMIEFVSWAQDFYKDKDSWLEDSFEEAMKQLRRTGTGAQGDLEPRRLRLPACQRWRKTLVLWWAIQRQHNGDGGGSGHHQTGQPNG